MDPSNVSPLVVWLGSDEARAVTGRVFEIEGGQLSVADGWHHGTVIDKGDRWDPAELTPVITQLIAEGPAPGPGLRRVDSGRHNFLQLVCSPATRCTPTKGACRGDVRLPVQLRASRHRPASS